MGGTTFIRSIQVTGIISSCFLHLPVRVSHLSWDRGHAGFPEKPHSCLGKMKSWVCFYIFQGNQGFEMTCFIWYSNGGGEPCCEIELLWWWICSIETLPRMVATSHVWWLGTWDVASVTEELDFLFYFIVINLNVSRHMKPVAVVLDSTGVEQDRAEQICCRLGMILTFPELLFSLLCSGDHNDTWLIGLMWGINKEMNIKHLAQ